MLSLSPGSLQAAPGLFVIVKVFSISLATPSRPNPMMSLARGKKKKDYTLPLLVRRRHAGHLCPDLPHQ